MLCEDLPAAARVSKWSIDSWVVSGVESGLLPMLPRKTSSEASRRAPGGPHARGSVGASSLNFTIVLLVLAVLAVVFVLVLLFSPRLSRVTSALDLSASTAFPVPAARVLERRDGWGPIATWSERERTLRVTNQLAADALLCIRRDGAETCKLTAEWLAR